MPTANFSVSNGFGAMRAKSFRIRPGKIDADGYGWITPTMALKLQSLTGLRSPTRVRWWRCVCADSARYGNLTSSHQPPTPGAIERGAAPFNTR